MQGEISNLHRAGSGHIYFTLKDDRGQIRAALFRSSASRVRFELEEGVEVIAGADHGHAAADNERAIAEIEAAKQQALNEVRAVQRYLEFFFANG